MVLPDETQLFQRGELHADRKNYALEPVYSLPTQYVAILK
jgi:hypothetical protein